METVTTTLTEFLLARIAEDFADAMSGWRWKSLPAGEYGRLQARVLAECEAKRRLIEYHAAGMLYVESGADDELSHVWYRNGLVTLRLLALPYADHPDYRDEWKP